jgi:electron transfer flavoprotein alpha subunit
MKVLVIAEKMEDGIKKPSLEALGLATRLGNPVEAVLLGAGLGDLATLLAHYGASKVYVADDASLEPYTAEAYTAVLADLVEKIEPGLILLGATAMGRDLAPRLAARLGIALASDCTDLQLEDGNIQIIRPMYAGKLIATVRQESMPHFATLRPNVLPMPEPDTSRTAAIEPLVVPATDIRAQVKEIVETAAGQVELTEATIIVSGGRGVKGPEGFEPVRELAQVLGAALGASRAAVDAGWIPYAHQVGQTGKTVTPNLYIACGISGAIQHLAGMKTAQVIVAVNKDPDAPIFKVADYGIVGDLFDVVPALTTEFEKLLAD